MRTCGWESEQLMRTCGWESVLDEMVCGRRQSE